MKPGAHKCGHKQACIPEITRSDSARTVRAPAARVGAFVKAARKAEVYQAGVECDGVNKYVSEGDVEVSDPQCVHVM